MAAPFVRTLLGRRNAKGQLPNTSDSNSKTSVQIAEHILQALELPTRDFIASDSPGTQLEKAVAQHLGDELNRLGPGQLWTAKYKDNAISSFAQYRHLARLKKAIDDDKSGTLRIVVGGDYLVKPDVTVTRGRERPPLLHASVSCKWTLRSDRAQNARTEARGLLSNRKGRAPHIVVVTAEPLPSRIASLGFGTGDIDAVYHISYPELLVAVKAEGNPKELQDLNVMVQGDRLRDYNELAGVLSAG